jgi:hypothetical protein
MSPPEPERVVVAADQLSGAGALQITDGWRGQQSDLGQDVHRGLVSGKAPRDIGDELAADAVGEDRLDVAISPGRNTPS